MKIVLLQGSPVLKGSSHLFASEFIRGVREAGHEVTELEITRMDIHPCIGCLHCGYEGPWAQRDDMLKVKDELQSSDMVVFATPLYYYGMSARLKTVVDRFCFFNSPLHAKRPRSALIASAWNGDEWTFDALKTHCRTLVR